MRTSTGILKHLIRCRTVKAACTLGSYFIVRFTSTSSRRAPSASPFCPSGSQRRH